MSTAAGVRIGIIGGSGLYQMLELTAIEEVKVDTPFGPTSDAFIVGTLEGERVAFLPRHGRGHRFTPTEVPFRANIYGMKLLGVERVLSASAVGYGDPGSVFRPYASPSPRVDVLRRRHRGARHVCASGL